MKNLNERLQVVENHVNDGNITVMIIGLGRFLLPRRCVGLSAWRLRRSPRRTWRATRRLFDPQNLGRTGTNRSATIPRPLRVRSNRRGHRNGTKRHDTRRGAFHPGPHEENAIRAFQGVSRRRGAPAKLRRMQGLEGVRSASHGTERALFTETIVL